MMMALRRLLATVAVGFALLVGLPMVAAQAAPTPTPTPSATAAASAVPTDEADTSDSGMSVTPDAAVDNSRLWWMLAGAGVVAVAAAAVVIARH